MSSAITFEDIKTLIAVIGPLGGMWWYLQAQITKNRTDLDEYKLLVSEKYIKSENIQKLEERLLASEVRMIASIDSLSDRIDRLVDRLPAKTTRGA